MIEDPDNNCIKELKRIDKKLWERLYEQEDMLNSDKFVKDEGDMHYLDGKREGFEKALMILYEVDDVEKNI